MQLHCCWCFLAREIKIMKYSPKLDESKSEHNTQMMSSPPHRVVNVDDSNDDTPESALEWCCFSVGVIIALPLSIPLTVFIFCSITVICYTIMIIMVLSLILIRIFQLIRWGNDYEKLTQFKLIIRFWLYFFAGMSIVGLWMFYALAKYVPFLKQVIVLEMPLTKWVVLTSVMCGLCILSTFLNTLAHQAAAMRINRRHSLIFGQACSEIIDGLILLWAADEVMKRVPSVREHHEILGLSTAKWIKVSVFILIGYNLITLFTRFIALLLEKLSQRRPLTTDTITFKRYVMKNHLRVRYLVYYANGIAVSISFVLSSLLLLLTWIFYFRTHLSGNNAASIWEYGKWTLVSLFIFSFLWLIKTCVLLAWEAHTIYDRLQDPIISTCEQLYFLIILGTYNPKLRQHTAQHHDYLEKSLLNAKHLARPTSFMAMLTEISRGFKTPKEARKKLQRDLLFPENADPNLNHLEQGTQYFALVKEHLLKETYTSEILAFFKETDVNREKLKNLVLARVDPQTPNPIESEIERETRNKEIEEQQAEHSTRNLTTSQSPVPPVDKQNGEDQMAALRYSAVKDRFVKRLLLNINQQNSNEKIPYSEIQAWVAESDIERETKNKEIEEQQTECSTRNLTTSQSPVQPTEVESGQEQMAESSTSRSSTVWDRFVKRLLPNANQQNSNEIIHYSEIQAWVERAHNQCMNLINTLSSAEEVAECLNKIISWLLVGGIFIMWLLLTGLATTKVLVLIASPLLAATFIFGNTCKTLFEGILFVYVVHPIDVGDLCFIDDQLMEVQSIGVWTTTFTKVDKFGTTLELVIYSNAELTKKTITNYKTKFDWSDQETFNLSPVKMEDLENQNELIKLVKMDLNEKDCSFLSRSPNLTISALEDTIKLVIRLEYKPEITKEWTFAECLRQKLKLRGDFHLIMKGVIKKFED
ncbi:Mechanosensitive ion channel protein 10 [Bienertia sinuspersici]